MEDRRGQGAAVSAGAACRSRWARAPAGSDVILAVVLALLFGGEHRRRRDGDSGFSPAAASSPRRPAEQGATPEKGEDTLFEFTKFVSKDAQDTVDDDLPNADRQYQRAPVVDVHERGRRPAAGRRRRRSGPFYCPADNKVYLDLSFYQQLSRRFGAPGDFAWAYVVAHEIGHHVQTVLGIEANVRRQQQNDPGNANLYLVRLELQADCFAGVWAHSAYERGVLEAGDIEEAVGAAAAVGRRPARGEEPGAVDARLLGAPAEWFRRRLRVRRTRTTATPATSRSERVGTGSSSHAPLRPRYPPGKLSRRTEMTELAEAPAVERDGAITRIPHWIGGTRVDGTSGRTGPVYNPATGVQSGAVDLASVEEVDAAVRNAERGVHRRGARRRSRSAPSCSSPSASCSTRGARTSRRSSPRSTARCSRTRWARSRAGSR